MTNPIARQPKGIPAGGQFAPTSHAEPDVSLTPGDGRPEAAQIIDAAIGRVDLRFVHYDDRLTEDQIEMLLAGDWTGAENAVDDVLLFS